MTNAATNSLSELSFAWLRPPRLLLAGLRGADLGRQAMPETAARELGCGYIGAEHVLAMARASAPVDDCLPQAGLTWDRAQAAFDAIEWGSA